MILYLSILKAFLSYEIYTQYEGLLDRVHIKENYPQIFRLLLCLGHLHQDDKPKTCSVADLEVTYVTLYPNTPERDYKSIIEALEKTEVSIAVISGYLKQLDKRAKATLLARKALAVAEGQADAEELNALQLDWAKDVSDSETTQDFIDDTLEAVYQKQVADPGLKWRLDSLNKSLGPLRKGDFGFIFARPETGKTTFLASEVTFMASQCNMPILWFNNEEQSEKVLLRCYQAALNKEVHDVFMDRCTSQQAYQQICKGKIHFPQWDFGTRAGIEKLCRKYNPSLIIIDQIDKITGFVGDRDDLELSAIYEWARGLAQIYGPVIGICQAGSTAEGKKWLTMNDVNNSKTGKQGEADFILGIGKSQDEALMYERYFHLCKNKLLGGLDTNNDLRHNKWVVRIVPERARYEDI